MTPRPLTDAERAEGRALLAEYRRRAKDKSDDSTAPGVHFAWDRAQVWLDGYLRNHAEALLDAADELARLKAGVADRDHTTHFDDCGCRSARYEAEVARLREQFARVDCETIGDPYRGQDVQHDPHCVRCCALASAPGSMDALREVCERAVAAAADWQRANHGTYDAPRRVALAAIVARLLKERSDDAPQGRGELGKEGGDA